MATYNDLNIEYRKIYNKDFPRATLSKWTRENRIVYHILPPELQKSGSKYDYDLESFLQEINKDEYKKKANAHKKKPIDYIGKTCGYLLITGIVPKEESQQPDYTGTIVYCKCLNCGNIIQERFSYVSGNGNYSRESCGCMRKIRTFLASAKILEKDNEEDIHWLMKFNKDWDRFSFLYHSIIRAAGYSVEDWSSKEEYKELFDFFWNDKQFNTLYDIWINKQNETQSTFYDWWKPSLDHIIPKSRGGTNKLNNFQFLTYYENHNKLDMTWDEWQQFKQETNTHSELYIEAIMKGGDVNEYSDELPGIGS